MVKILITDAVGLVGAYIIQALLNSTEFSPSNQEHGAQYSILAGYHSQAELEAARKSPLMVTPSIKPVLVDWADTETYATAVGEADRVLLLTPFTSAKLAQIDAWLAAVASSQRPIHIVHVGVHTDPNVTESARPPHESWNLAAEARIAAAAQKDTNLTATYLRINLDGFNTLLRPGQVAYYLPRNVEFGWIAREDIASFAAVCLLKPARFADQTFPLSVVSVSIDQMAATANSIMGISVEPLELSVPEFQSMALAAQPHDDGYADYIHSVVGMFEGLRAGKFAWHKQIFPDVFSKVVGRKANSFGEWLTTSPTKSRLLPKNM